MFSCGRPVPEREGRVRVVYIRSEWWAAFLAFCVDVSVCEEMGEFDR